MSMYRKNFVFPIHQDNGDWDLLTNIWNIVINTIKAMAVPHALAMEKDDHLYFNRS